MLHFLSRQLVIGLGVLAAGSMAHAQSFAPVVAYPTGGSSNPSGVATSDLNDDGYPDIVTANYGTSTAGVLLNTGNGTFAPVVLYTAGTSTYPQAVVVADVNRDSYPDIVMANRIGSLVSVLLNSGDGTFGAAVPYGAGINSYAEGVTVADINGDGYSDILTANGAATSTISVLLNKKDGTFAAATAYAGGRYPFDIAASDVDADGYPDLVVADYFSQAQVLLNKRDGTFTPAVGYSAGIGTQPVGIALGDVNNDGHPDIVTADFVGTVGVLLNKNTGTFEAARTYAAGGGGYPRHAAVGDVNGDGYVDILTANTNTNMTGVLLNQRDGTFAVALTYDAGVGGSPRSIAVSDVNHDGKPDLIVANYNTNAVGVLLNQNTPLAARPSAALRQAEATVYPNPAPAGSQTLAFTSLPVEVRGLKATLLNAQGQVVGRFSLAASQGAAHASLPTHGLPSGIYLLRLTAHDAQGAALGLLPSQHLSLL